MSLRFTGLLAAASMALAVATQAHAATAFKPFTADSLQAIRQAHSGKPFVLALWSVTCEPCHEEMAVLAEASQRYPGLAVALVNVDGPEAGARAATMLAQHPVARASQWQYADDYEERLRYAIDPAWRGELPRSYFFDAAHKPQARSGKVDAAWLNSWAARNGLVPASPANREAARR